MTPHAHNLDVNASLEPAQAIEGTALSTDASVAIANESKTKSPHANVLGVRAEALDMTATLARIEAALAARQKGYVCLAGVHGIMEAQRNPEVKRAFAGAFLKLPDGTPTVWVGRWQGLRWMQRLTGPDLMIEIFRNKQFAGYSHFFYGGKPGVADELSMKMALRFPWIRIAGTYTPPFHDLNSGRSET